jgi:DNA-binding winged helix-turn-helix (wHTH) protein/tetratricopeptide (TPR) repeat protein
LRKVDGPSGSVTIEPRVMQVLLALADARGAVLSRDDLMRLCWRGMVVGEDAVNRTIAEIRRLSRATGAGFTVETIPRIGYRLTDGAPAHGASEPGAVSVAPETAPEVAPAASHPQDDTGRPVVSRRWLLAGALGAAGIAAIALWRGNRPPAHPQFDALIENAQRGMRIELVNGSPQVLADLERALALRPDSALAWGLLAQVHSILASDSTSKSVATSFEHTEEAAERALSLDAREPHALFARLRLQRGIDDWITTERKLREVLRIDPGHEGAQDYLIAMLQAAGYVRESRELNDQALVQDPLRPVPLHRKALKLWIEGRPLEAAVASERAMQIWPTMPFVWNAQLLIAAFTGQWELARRLVGSQPGEPPMLSREAVDMWQVSLRALEQRTPEAIGRAREAILAAAARSRGLGVHAVLVLSDLGENDAAFEVIDGMLLLRGSLVTQAAGQGTPLEDHSGWKETQWLFTPATASLRADPRFERLVEAIGIADFWRARGIPPDERAGG